METFKQNIKSWLDIDDEIKKHNEIIKELRRKKQYEYENINAFAEDNNMTRSIFAVHNGNLKFTEVKQQQPLTLKYIHECLEDCLISTEDINNVLKHIKDNRSYKVNRELKRYKKT